MTREPVDRELFNRTAPKWNCVDYDDGMHYLPGDRCLWCGRTREQINTVPVPEIFNTVPIAETLPMQPHELGRYVCVAAGKCLYSPYITINTDGLWVRLPDSLNPGSYVYSSAHRRCYEHAEETKIMRETKIVRVNGVQWRVPDDELPDPNPDYTGETCNAVEPDWSDGTGQAVCTIAPHPSSVAHIAHDGEGVVAIWGTPAVINNCA